MTNKMMRIFFPLKIVPYPKYGSDGFAEKVARAKPMAHEDAILAAIARENRHFGNGAALRKVPLAHAARYKSLFDGALPVCQEERRRI